MKKPYKEPRIIIERFPDEDVIVCSGFDWGEDPEGTNRIRHDSDDA